MEKEKATIVLLLLEKKKSVLTVYDLTLVRLSGREDISPPPQTTTLALPSV